MDHAALIVVDLQNGFLNEHSRHVLTNVEQLVRAFRQHDLPIVFSRFVNSSDSPFVSLLDWDHLLDSPETDLHADLVGSADTIIEKGTYTALTPELLELIEKSGSQTLVLCGVATEACVLKTALDTFEAGLRPIVVSDACASDICRELHDAGLLILRNLIGPRQVLTTSEILGLI